jgi:hypothetical protein
VTNTPAYYQKELITSIKVLFYRPLAVPTNIRLARKRFVSGYFDAKEKKKKFYNTGTKKLKQWERLFPAPCSLSRLVCHTYKYFLPLSTAKQGLTLCPSQILIFDTEVRN